MAQAQLSFLDSASNSKSSSKASSKASPKSSSNSKFISESETPSLQPTPAENFLEPPLLEIHLRAVRTAKDYQDSEVRLIEILQEVEETKIHFKLERTSLFDYAVKDLGLARDRAYDLITIARKAREVPELKTEIQKGSIPVSSARRLAAVLTPGNHKEWLAKGAQLSVQKLQKEIVRVKPQEATRERASYATPERIRLELGLSERLMLQLRRAQDLVSQSRRSSATLEDTLDALVSEYLRRHDPVEKATRHRVRRGGSAGSLAQGSRVSRSEGPKLESRELQTQNSEILEAESRNPGGPDVGNKAAEVRAQTQTQSKELRASQNNPLAQTQRRPGLTWATARSLESKSSEGKSSESKSSESKSLTSSVGKLGTNRVPRVRSPIPTKILHTVNLRDRRRCTHRLSGGSCCGSRRWIEIHHRIPVSEGGTHALENLITLCSAHHRLWHERMKRRSG